MIDHGRRHSVKGTKSHGTRAVLFSSFHAMTSCVIYYSTQARQNEIYLLSIIDSVVYNVDFTGKC